MTLAQARAGERLKVVGRVSGRGLASHLDGIGLHVGDEVIVVSTAPFHGPLLLELPSSGIRIAMGRGVAEKVFVEPTT